MSQTYSPQTAYAQQMDEIVENAMDYAEESELQFIEVINAMLDDDVPKDVEWETTLHEWWFGQTLKERKQMLKTFDGEFKGINSIGTMNWGGDGTRFPEAETEEKAQQFGTYHSLRGIAMIRMEQKVWTEN